MIVEVKGVEFRNKGAELMLHAVVEQAARWPGEVKLAVSPSLGSYRQRAALGLYQMLAPARLGALAGPAGRVLPRKLRAAYGIVAESDVDAVVDASGFSYSDQWGTAASERLALQAGRWRRQGKPVVLLPQALGPFRDPKSRDAMRRVLDDVDLVFPRDASSAAHLAELGGGGRARVRQAPDFTVAVAGRLPASFHPEPGMVAIIPNYRMIDRGRAGSGPAYRALLAGTAAHLRARGYRPFFLVHDAGSDRELAEEVRAEVGGGVEVLHEPDPRALKGILGACHAVVASRFHALVGALTQGVPSLATGWSHKYEELFAEFGCPEALCDVAAPLPDSLARLDALLEGPGRERVVEGLRRTRAEYARRTVEMWREVGAVLGVAPPPDPAAERAGAG